MRSLAVGKVAVTVVAALLLCAFPQYALAKTITVTSTGDSGKGTLRYAIQEEAKSGDTIVLPAGTYKLTSKWLQIEPTQDNITIEGAGARNTILEAKSETVRPVFDIYGAGISISGLTITGVDGHGEGGAIALEEGSLVLTGVALNANSLGVSGGFGGGIFDREGAELTVRDSTISNNQSAGAGGVFVDDKSTAVIENTTISGNRAGGPTYNGDGGGIETRGTLTLVNDTIVDNYSSNGGGGVNGTISAVKNTIIADNKYLSYTENCSYEAHTTGPNLENVPGDGSGCGFAKHGGIEAEPLLEPLADNGGELETMALQWGSPAIDAGTNEGCPATDERGVARPQLGTCDLGAYEYQALVNLGISQSALPTAPTVGEAVAFTLKVSNAGPDPAPGVVVQDTLPAGATLASAVPSQGSCGGLAPLKCSLGALTSGASATIVVTMKVGQAGTATNTASVSSEGTDTNAVDNSSQLGVTVSGAPPPAPQSPSISGLAQSHAAWLEKKSRAHKHVPVGTRFSFTLDEAASVTLTFTQRIPGRNVKGKCVAPTSKNHHADVCKRTVTRGAEAIAGRAGTNTLSVTGRLPHIGYLRPGTYTVEVVATNGTGKSSAPETLTFSII
jgi:uncharacterized repeat protein (TIGR01451 family)